MEERDVESWLQDLERRVAAIETAVSVLRWIIPIVVTGSGVLIVLAR